MPSVEYVARLLREECVIDRIVVNAKTDRVWGSYVGGSGKRRYVSLGTHETCEVVG